MIEGIAWYFVVASVLSGVTMFAFGYFYGRSVVMKRVMPLLDRAAREMEGATHKLAEVVAIRDAQLAEMEDK